MKTSSLVWRSGCLVGTAQLRRGKHLRDIWSLGAGYPQGRGNSGFRSAGGALTLGVVIRSGCGIEGEVKVEWVIPLSFLGWEGRGSALVYPASTFQNFSARI